MPVEVWTWRHERRFEFLCLYPDGKMRFLRRTIRRRTWVWGEKHGHWHRDGSEMFLEGFSCTGDGTVRTHDLKFELHEGQGTGPDGRRIDWAGNLEEDELKTEKQEVIDALDSTRTPQRPFWVRDPPPPPRHPPPVPLTSRWNKIPRDFMGFDVIDGQSPRDDASGGGLLTRVHSCGHARIRGIGCHCNRGDCRTGLIKR